MAADNDDQFEDELDSFEDVPEDDELPSEEALSDEDWDLYEEQPGESDQPDDNQPQDETPPAKKKSGSFNKIVIGVVVLGALGFMAMQMGGGAPQAPADQQAATPPAVNPSAPEPEPEASGLLSSPQGLAQLQQDIAKRTPAPTPEPAPQAQPKEVNDAPVPPMPTALTTPEKVAENAPEQLPDPVAPVPAAPTSPGVVQAETHMPSAQDVMLKKTEPALAPALAEPAPVTATPAVPDNSVALEEKQAQIDSLQARINGLEGTLKELNDKAAKDQGKISELQKKLAEKSLVPAPVAKTEAPAPIPTSKPEPQILGSMEPPQDTAEVSTATPVQATPKMPIAKPAATKVSSEWVLKGAQPGRAMVAKPGENEIKTVEVGDTLSGIGKVTGVVYENGRWSVQGTKGRINQ